MNPVPTSPLADDLATVLSVSEMKLRGKSIHSWCDGSSDQFFMGGHIQLILIPASAP